ncbi:hypothetical protein [Phenylobacterium sp.]|uniref:hypothetical protein n=1 Tax=Phenylobacterium sp. TaxID=1871053 RepID=UPI003D2957C1
MNLFRAAMLSLAAATAFGGPALAIPPLSPAPAEQALVARYIEAVRANDHNAYAKLFAPDADIQADWPAASGRDGWLRAVARELAPTRRTRFLAVFSEFATVAGKPAARVLIVQEIKDCRPNIAECFGQFRSETLTVQNGRIVALDRSGYTHRLNEPGGWTIFAP